MGKWVNGTLKASLNFYGVYVDDGQDVMDALFPGGWEGELDYDLRISEEEPESEN